MNKNVIGVVLFAAVAGLGVVVVRQNREIERVKKSGAAESAALEAKVAALSKAAWSEAKKGKSVAATTARTSEAADRMPAPAEPAQPVMTQVSGPGTNLMGAVAEMMKNPQMKEMVRAQQKVMMNQMYGALPRYLNMSAETKEQLDKLLLDRQLAMTEVGLAMMNGTEEERKMAVEEAKTVKAECDRAIQELLGDQDYEIFKQYEQSMPEQTHVSMFKSTLAGDDTLSEQQEYDLVSAMYQARKDLPQDSLLNQQNESPDPSQLTEERIAQTLKQMEDVQQRYAEGAATILGASQLERFKQWQEQMATMQKAGLNIAAQMFGQGKGAAAPTQK